MRILLSAAILAGAPFLAPAAIEPVAEKVACAVPDVQDAQTPDRVLLSGWLGGRIVVNEAKRLAVIDTDRLLEGYRKRPGRQSWDGEHVGKWLHAASLAWANTGDPALRRKLDEVVVQLGRCQLPDGYLGTYLDKDRWTDWDVWAHKYNLLGLISYMRLTGNMEPLPVCRKMADLLCVTFGDEPGRRDLLKAGHHAGMAPTSVLEPMVLLYRLTGEARHRAFCDYILRAWERPDGPQIVSRLLELKRVDKVGNAKAYEMLSCINGLLEYHRTCGGDRRLLDAALHAWQDIVDKRLYLTGAASYREHFHDDFDLPNVNNVGETCVTVTWLQFNAHLLRLTGEARFAEQLERVVLNQLLGAQRPDGTAWGYYVQMEGRKPYSATLDGHCCLSSGPRGVALIPTFALTTDGEGIVVNLYDAGRASLTLRDGTPVAVDIATRYPADAGVELVVAPAAERRFAVKLRVPAWCTGATIRVNGRETAAGPAGGYAQITRDWRKGDRIGLNLPLAARAIAGGPGNEGRVALQYGPLVLAADDDLLAGAGQQVNTIALPAGLATTIAPEPAPDPFRTWADARVFRVKALARRTAGAVKAGSTVDIALLPFADAGAQGARYKVWLPTNLTVSGNLLTNGAESRSRTGNVTGSIIDDDPHSFVVTYDGKAAEEDWFAVRLEEPAAFDRVVYCHGRSFHDGGWFDAAAGKPRIQIQAVQNGPWTTVAELAGYPATTATDSKGLREGQMFTQRLPDRIRAIAVRVMGRPSCGDDARQSFSSCAELQVFADRGQ